MRRLRKHIIALTTIFLFCANVGFSTHYMGSDMTWQCVGQDSFIVTLTLYRDCNGVNMANANISFKCKTTGTLITTKGVSLPSPTDITPTCNESCSRCSSSSCTFAYGMHRLIYNTGIINLSGAGNCCQILMTYQGCCRNSIITTGLQNYQFYCDAQLNRCVTPCDNSPVFTNPPLTYICAGQDIFYNLGAIDIDRDSNGLLDSLTFEFTPPLAYNANIITYSSPYSFDKPLWFSGFPNPNLPFPQGIHLDPNTGDIMFRPMKTETTVLAYIIKEFRNGVLIGSIRRDVQLSVINCPNNNPPVLSGPYFKEVFARDTVIFNINTNDYDVNDSLTISCNHNIQGASWTDNNGQARNPSGTFSWITGENDISSNPYKFLVTVDDGDCPILGIQSRIFEIIVRPHLFVYLGSDTDLCYGDTLLLSPIYPTLYQTLKYQWSTDPNDTFPTNSLLLTKDILISLTITDTNNQTYTDTLNVKVHNLPVVNLGQDIRVCTLDTIKLYPSYTLDRSILSSVRWKEILSGNTISNILYADITDSGVYECYIIDAVGCGGYDTIEINVNPELKAVSPDTNMCFGDTTTIEAEITGGGNVKYYWYKNEVLEDTGRKIYINPTVTTEYDLIVSEIIDSVTCYDTAKVEVVVYDLPSIELANFPERCISDTSPIYLNSFATPKGGYWSCDCSGLSAPDKFSPSLSGFGDHTVYYAFTDSITGCFNRDTGIITIHSLPDATLYINGDSLAVLPGMSSYQWFKDGDSILGATNNYYIPTINGTYQVTVNDSNGCQASSSPFIFTGIDNRMVEKEVIIYPNPNSGVFTIVLKQNLSEKEVMIKITSIYGEEIQSFIIDSLNLQKLVDMRALPKGIYILDINYNNGYRYLKKIIYN